MTSIPLVAFRETVEAERAQQGTRNYEWNEAGELVPTPGNAAPPTAPTRRPARPLPTGPSPFGILSGAIDDACNIRRAIGPSAFRNSTLPTAALSAASPTWRNTFDDRWDRLCGDSPGAYPTTEYPIVPFQGGQCNGARYNVQVTVQVRGSSPGCSPANLTTGTASVWGPITAVDLGAVGGSGQFVRVFCRGQTASPIAAPGQIVSLGAYNNTPGCPAARIVNVVVTPQSGQPNNCGNPPPRYPPVGQTAIPSRPITIDLGGTPVQITPQFSFNLDEGAIQIDLGPDLNVSFDGVNINFGDSNGGGTPGSTPVRPSPDDSGTDPAEPPPDPPEDDPTLEEPPEQPNRVIRAALVTVANPGSGATQVAGIAPDPANYFGDLGLIKFRIKADGSATGFTNSIRVQNRRAFIPCPWDGGALEVVGTPRPGVVWTVTPVYDVGSLPE